ncbi:MAG: putative rane protein conserved [Acidobacteria bacterium]|nr:putative rane protein conserved [Acidobacteriota bacterium]
MESYPSTGKSAIGLEANLAAALGYPIGILGLINFFMDKENKFVRFHGIQSVLYSVALGVIFTVVMVVLAIVGAIASQISGALAILVWILYLLAFLAGMVLWLGVLLYSAYRAYQGQTFKLPLVGNFAEKMVEKN